MSARHRIDVHQHIVPPFWADALSAHGADPSGWACPAWSADSAIAFMDSVGTAAGVLSLTAPSVKGWSGQAKRDIARRVNAYTAEVVARHPTRFGNFATLPLPDVDGALAEIAHAFDTLKVDGVVLMSNHDGAYLGEPAFDPVWNELDRRQAVVFIHPAMPAIAPLKGMPGPMIDYPFDTTRTAVHLVVNGVVSRYPNVRIILSHAGGFLPYAAQRVATVAPMANKNSPSADTVLAQLQTFYFDTALSAPSALPSLAAFAKPGHILYGSDFPYAPSAAGAAFAAQQDASAVFSAQQQAAINRSNALALFPRLAALDR